MHSHFGLQEQNLLAAPLIVREQSGIRVIFLEDFSWTPPRAIFENLRRPKPMAMSREGMSAPDLNDVTYEAFLANDRHR
jgi:hypothetical protein